MTQQLPKKAIQLIAFDNNKNPFIPSQALQVLQKMSTNSIHVISVAGKYRTGKSYLLNRVLLDRSDGFSVGSTINACTKGLWMWPQLVKLGNKDCLIIDTEGLGSLEEGESTDLKIFMLSLLFSSYLIYNSAGTIDEQALQNLNLVIQLANVLQRQDRYDTQQLVNTFPSFLWLLRDFSLQLVNQQGQTITTTQYLQQALKHQQKSTPAAERKNQIRKQLRTFFQDRDCFALVRPTQQEKDLQNLNSLQSDKLRPEFIEMVKNLKNNISSSVRPKRVKGRILSTEGFIELCKYYTKALVDGKMPTITSHWDNLCLGQTHRIFQKFQLQHIRALQASLQDQEIFHLNHKSIIKQGFQAIDKSFLGKLEKQLFKQRFQRKLSNQYQELKIKISNQKNIEFRLMLDSLQEIQDEDLTIFQKYQRLMEKMTELSEKSTKDDGVYCELYLYLSEHSRNLLQESESNRFETEKKLSEKISYLSNLYDQLKIFQNKGSEFHQKQLSGLREQNRILKKLNSLQQKSRQNERESEMAELQRNNIKLKRYNQELSLQLIQIKGRFEHMSQKMVEKIENNTQLEDKCQYLDIQLAKKEQILREQGVKMRKLIRESDIVKNRYHEYLEDNLKLKQNIENLQEKVLALEVNQYKQNSLNHSKQINDIKRRLMLSQQQLRTLNQFIKDQKNTYEAILESPQNKLNASIKRNLEVELKEKQYLKIKLYQASVAISNCQTYSCLNCHQSINGKIVLQHSKICKQEYHFNVELIKDSHGQICFEIQSQYRNNKQIVTKTVEEVKEFLPKITQSTFSTVFQQHGENNSDSSNLCEERRVFLNSILKKVQEQSLNSPTIIQFLQLDTLSQFHSELKDTPVSILNQ